MFQDFLPVFSKFIEVVLMALAPIVATLFAVWLKAKIAQVKSSLSPELAYTLAALAEIAVQAAEQSDLAGYVGGKKDYAIEALTAMLKAQGIELDLAGLDAAIEAAVWQEFKKPAALPEEL